MLFDHHHHHVDDDEIGFLKMMTMIHLDLLKDDGEPSSHALVPSKARTNYHTLHTGQPHLVFGYLVFGTEYYISPGPTSTLCTRDSHGREVIEDMT